MKSDLNGFDGGKCSKEAEVSHAEIAHNLPDNNKYEFALKSRAS
jgi:hypothetical protein